MCQFVEAAPRRQLFAGIIALINGLCGSPFEVASAWLCRVGLKPSNYGILDGRTLTKYIEVGHIQEPLAEWIGPDPIDCFAQQGWDTTHLYA